MFRIDSAGSVLHGNHHDRGHEAFAPLNGQEAATAASLPCGNLALSLPPAAEIPSTIDWRGIAKQEGWYAKHLGKRIGELEGVQCVLEAANLPFPECDFDSDPVEVHNQCVDSLIGTFGKHLDNICMIGMENSDTPAFAYEMNYIWGVIFLFNVSTMESFLGKDTPEYEMCLAVLAYMYRTNDFITAEDHLDYWNETAQNFLDDDEEDVWLGENGESMPASEIIENTKMAEEKYSDFRAYLASIKLDEIESRVRASSANQPLKQLCLKMLHASQIVGSLAEYCEWSVEADNEYDRDWFDSLFCVVCGDKDTNKLAYNYLNERLKESGTVEPRIIIDTSKDVKVQCEDLSRRAEMMYNYMELLGDFYEATHGALEEE